MVRVRAGYTLRVAAESRFSCELEGSTASLLGTGVTVEGFLLSWSELDLVVSFRQGEEAGCLVDALEACWDWDWEALEKKPRMLCCFAPAEAAEGVLLDEDGVFAGVRVSPMVYQYLGNKSPELRQPNRRYDATEQRMKEESQDAAEKN